MKHTETREKVRSGPLKTDFLETFLKHPRRHTQRCPARFTSTYDCWRTAPTVDRVEAWPLTVVSGTDAR